MIEIPEIEDIREKFYDFEYLDIDIIEDEYGLYGLCDYISKYDIFKDSSDGNYEDNIGYIEGICDETINHLEYLKKEFDKYIEKIKEHKAYHRRQFDFR